MPLHKRLHVGWRDQPHIVSHRLQLARPVMRAAARFERHNTCRLANEKIEQLPPRELATEDHGTAFVSAVRMKNVLGDIQTNCGNLQHGRLP